MIYNEIDAPHLGQEIGGAETGTYYDNKYLAPHGTLCKTLFDYEVFEMFVHPGEIIEVRIMCLDGKKGMILSGYFDNYEDFCREVQEIDTRQHAGIYFTLQVIDPRLIARSCNRLKTGDLTTSDKDVLYYRWLPIDLDPVRPSGISSSESELKTALELRENVTKWVMQEYQSEAPIKAVSGNGGHLLFSLPDWPVDDKNKTLIKNILEEVSERFSTDKVKIDTSVYNPSRIWKLYGTMTRKGDEITANPYREARPHRMAYIDDLGVRHD